MSTRRERQRRPSRRGLMCEVLEPRVLLCGDGTDDTWCGDWDWGFESSPADTQPADDSWSSDWSDSSWDYPSDPVYVYPPATPYQPWLQSPSSSSIFIKWWPGSDDADGFEIARFGDSGRWITIADVDADTTSFTDTRLQMGTTYYYSIIAYNDGGYSDYSDVSSYTIPLSDDPTLVGQFAHLPYLPKAVWLNFRDADGTDVTLTLTGPGAGTLHLTPDGYDLTLSGTTLSSALTIKTVRTRIPGDDGRFQLHSLTVGDASDTADLTALGTLKAASTDLAGSMMIAGQAHAVTLGNVAGQTRMDIGAHVVSPAARSSLNLVLGSVQDLTINSAIGINLLQASNWADTDAAADSITAPWLNRLSVTGNRKLSLAGDFQADLHLTSDAGATAKAPALGTASIAGAVGADTWTIAGNVGKFVAGDVTIATFTVVGSIKALSAQRWNAGAISARTLGALSITGRKGVGGFAGDFRADVALAGPPAAPSANALGSATIAGSLADATWTIAGKLGTLTVKGNASNVSLTAGSIGTIAVAGDLAAAQLRLTQPVSRTLRALGSLSAGRIIDTQIRSAGNIGSLRVNILESSLIFAGVSDAVTTRPATPADFVDADPAKLPVIQSVTVRGLASMPAAAVFTNSTIAAGRIIAVTLPRLVSAIGDLDGSVQPFGFATRDGSVVKYSGPVSSGDFVSGSDSHAG